MTDEAGNVANLGPYTVNVDFDAPTIAISTPDDLVAVVDGVVPSSLPIYNSNDDSSALLADSRSALPWRPQAQMVLKT